MHIYIYCRYCPSLGFLRVSSVFIPYSGIYIVFYLYMIIHNIQYRVYSLCLSL